MKHKLLINNLKAIQKLLKNIENEIKQKYQNYKGSKTFEPKPIKSIFNDENN